MANQNCITPHVWTSRAPDLYTHVCVFDLDPSNDDADVLRNAALRIRDLLAELGLPSYVKTSGSKGYHIVVPLDGKTNMGEAAGFAHRVGSTLVERDRAHLTQEFSKADRGGRIYVDTGRNGYSATFAAAYTVRAKPGAPVSAPCTWEEVELGTVCRDAHRADMVLASNRLATCGRTCAAGDTRSAAPSNGCHGYRRRRGGAGPRPRGRPQRPPLRQMRIAPMA